MNYTEKKSLYESIMNDVARIVKRRIVEAAGAADKKIVVFTGKSKYFAGDKVEKFIEKHTDFKTSHTVNDKTYMIVTGEKPGPKKIDYAAKNGIIVMSEDKFFAKYNLTDELPEKLNESSKSLNEFILNDKDDDLFDGQPHTFTVNIYDDSVLKGSEFGYAFSNIKTWSELDKAIRKKFPNLAHWNNPRRNK